MWQYTKPVFTLFLASELLSALQFGHSAHLMSIHGFGFSALSALATSKSFLPILCVMELGLLLPATTSAKDMQLALTHLLAPLRSIRFPVEAFSLAAALLLRFIPVILQQLERFSRIAKARGKRTTRIGQIRIRDVPAVVIPLLLSILQLGEEFSLALEARGYKHTKQKLSHHRELHMQKLDRIALLLSGGLCILLVLMRIGPHF